MIHWDTTVLRYFSRMTWNFTIILSRGGQHSLITGSLEKFCIHADSSGNFSSSTKFRFIISSRMLIILAVQPKAMSRYPIVSPPKNFFSFSNSSMSFRFWTAAAIGSSCSFPWVVKTFHIDEKSCIAQWWVLLREVRIYFLQEKVDYHVLDERDQIDCPNLLVPLATNNSFLNRW